jgi:hypothetical protein
VQPGLTAHWLPETWLCNLLKKLRAQRRRLKS